jgi:katanin p60 ATPase-containing subunit A1
MKTELLIQLDGLIKSSNERVFLLAASNLPWELDAALLRRLEKRILVTLPSLEAREDMVRKLLPPEKAVQDLDYSTFAVKLDGYSGSDIRLVCKEAAMKPLRRLMREIETVTDFDKINWSVQADPKTIPGPGPVTNEDLVNAIGSTKAAA